MSGTNTPTDPAIEEIEEQIRELDRSIEAGQRRIEIDTGIRERLNEVLGIISRKPRARRARTVVQAPGESAPVANPVIPAAPPVPWSGFQRQPETVNGEASVIE